MVSEKEFAEIQIGDMVRIVDEWDENTEQNWDGYMDAYLGNVYQVFDRSRNYLKLYLPYSEDEEIWEWNRYCIAEVINHKNIEYNGDFSSLI